MEDSWRNLTVRLSFSEDAVKVERLADTIVVPETITARAKVLKALAEGGPMYSAEIAEVTGLDKKTVQNRISELHKASVVVHTGESAVALTRWSSVPVIPILIKGTGIWESRDISSEGEEV
jgi:hypothetical protein